MGRFVAVLLSLATGLPSLQAQGVGWRAEDRLIIGDFSRVAAVAAGYDRAYAVTPDAVLVLDPRTRTLVRPIPAPTPGALRGAHLALVDPLDGSLWLASRSYWLHFQPDLELWDDGAAPGIISAIALDADDPLGGLYLRTSRGWAVVPPGGLSASPSGPPARPQFATTLRDALEANPALEGFAAGILLEGRRTPARYTSAAETPDGLGWLIGTDGLGVLWLPRGGAFPEPIAAGLVTELVGALFAVPGGVWAATEPTHDREGAITWVAEDASESRTLGGRFGTGFEFRRAWGMGGAGRTLWVGTDAGLLRVPTDDSPIERLDESADLPDRWVYGVRPWRDEVYVATRGGVARVDAELRVSRIVPEFPGPAFAVAVREDTVWVGTLRGPFEVTADGRDLARLDAPDLRAELREPVVGFAWAGDTLVALSRHRLLHRDPASRAWVPGPDLGGDLGELRALAADGDGFWVAGARAVGFVRIGGSTGLPLRETGDLPGEVYDLAVEGRWLWVGTARGLVRFALEAIRP